MNYWQDKHFHIAKTHTNACHHRISNICAYTFYICECSDATCILRWTFFVVLPILYAQKRPMRSLLETSWFIKSTYAETNVVNSTRNVYVSILCKPLRVFRFSNLYLFANSGVSVCVCVMCAFFNLLFCLLSHRKTVFVGAKLSMARSSWTNHIVPIKNVFNKAKDEHRHRYR